MSSPFSRPLVLDGGLATELERRGADLRDPLWSASILLKNPALIREVHLAYLKAGADIITTASYQASLDGLTKRGLNQTEATRVLSLSVEIAKDARDCYWHETNNPLQKEKPLVAASMGTYGAILLTGAEFTGDFSFTEDELIRWHRPRVEILTQAGPDLLAFETIPQLTEARAIARLLSEKTFLPTWISFSCRDESHISSGETLLDAVNTVQDTRNVVAVGINCTAPQHISGLLESLKGVVHLPMLIYPNSGEIWDGERRDWKVDSAIGNFDWALASQQWRKQGASTFGGCCRTTPHTIELIAKSRGK